MKMPQVNCWTDISTMSAVLSAAGTLYINIQNSGNIPDQLQIGALSCCVNNGTTNLCGYSQNGIAVSGLQNTTLAAGANTTFIFNVGEPAIPVNALCLSVLCKRPCRDVPLQIFGVFSLSGGEHC